MLEQSSWLCSKWYFFHTVYYVLSVFTYVLCSRVTGNYDNQVSLLPEFSTTELSKLSFLLIVDVTQW